MKTLDVVSICNALVDILVQASDSDIQNLSLNKGIMHLVDDSRQQEVLKYIGAREKTEELGGSSLNAIRTLAALGAKTSFAGSIGSDEFGRSIERRLDQLSIRSKLQVAKSHTGICLILVTPDGERTMNTSLGASCEFDEAIVPEQDIANAKIFHFAGYQWANPSQIKAIRKALNIAKEQKTLVSFDLADPFVVQGNREAFLEVIREYADIVFCNREEARLLVNSTPEAACDFITESGAIAAVKLGAEGALIGEKDLRYRIAPVATQLVDTTAAGDMFAAGFLYGVARDRPLEICGRIAATLASDVISRLGANVSKSAIDKVQKL